MTAIWSTLASLALRPKTQPAAVPARRVRTIPIRREGVFEVAGLAPSIAVDAYLASRSIIVGDVRIGQRTSVWFGAVIRGDNGFVQLGEDSNVQDGSVLHGLPGNSVSVGSLVSIGHGAVVHGCAIGDCCLVGMQAMVMDEAEIGPDTIIGARALVTNGKRFPPGVLVLGSPAGIARDLTPQELDIQKNAREYVARAAVYRTTLRAI